MAFVIIEENSRVFAHKDSQGQHDGLLTLNIEDALTFETFGQACNASQNWGPTFYVIDRSEV